MARPAGPAACRDRLARRLDSAPVLCRSTVSPHQRELAPWPAPRTCRTALRHALPALSTGSYENLFAEGRVIAYARTDAEERVVVIINAGDSASTPEIPVGRYFADETVLQDQIGDRQVTVQDGKISGMTLPALSAVILA